MAISSAGDPAVAAWRPLSTRALLAHAAATFSRWPRNLDGADPLSAFLEECFERGDVGRVGRAVPRRLSRLTLGAGNDGRDQDGLTCGDGAAQLGHCGLRGNEVGVGRYLVSDAAARHARSEVDDAAEIGGA